MRTTQNTTRLGDLFQELQSLPKPADERKRLCREGTEITAAAVYLLDTAEDATPATIRPTLAKWQSDVDGWARTLGERDRAVCIVREMMALVSGDIQPPGAARDRNGNPEDQGAERDEEPGLVAPTTPPATVCAFPGDFRPLLHTDLNRVDGSTRERRHTTDWLLLQTAEVLLAQVRRLPREQAWRAYALLAEKLTIEPAEAARRAAGSPSVPPPSAEELARWYVGRPLSAHCYVAGSIIAEEILPHLGLGRADALGAMLHSIQEFSALDLHAVAEFLLVGPGDMRDYRKARGGQLCRRCGDYRNPGECYCRECGAVDFRGPVVLTVLAVLLLLPALGFRLWVSQALDAPFFSGSLLSWAVVLVGLVLAVRAIRGWKDIYRHYH